MKSIKILLLMMVWCLSAFAIDYTPQDIRNPNVADRRVYVSDPGNLVSAPVKESVNRELYALRQSTGTEVVVAVVPSIGDMPIEEFSVELFTEWGIGKSDKDNGVLILIAPEQRRAWITTGYGVEGVLPDISVKKIVDRSIVAYMKEGDLDGAVAASAHDVALALSDPVAAEELRSNEKEAWEKGPDALSSDTLMTFAMYVAGFFLLVGCCLFFRDLYACRHKDRYLKAMTWHIHRTAYWILAFCSFGMGIVWALLAEWQYRRQRNKPLKCSVCGGKMKKLGEEEDNALLSASQDFEEQLKTVDYDVWVCPDCGAVERFPFRAKQVKYTECPKCHTVAMCLVRDHTIMPATTRREGTGERIYECQFCHHQDRRRYRIPRKDDGAAAALAAGAIIGSMGRGGGGGGGFGGGFGGGSTGGGGAGGSW